MDSEVITPVVAAARPRSSKLVQPTLLPEVEIYLHLLVVIYLLDAEKLSIVIIKLFPIY